MAAKKQKAEKLRYTKYEIARMLGSRALQISMGAPPMIKISEKDLEKMNFNPVEIAKVEFHKDVLPLTVKRPFPDCTEKKK